MARVVYLAVLALAALLLACGGDSKSAAPTARPYVTPELDQDDTAATRFYLGGRAEFSICVDGTEGASATTAEVDAVREALELALSRLKEVPAAYASPVFVRGCPNATVLSAVLAGEELDYWERNTPRDRNQIIGDDLGPPGPNPHRTFVYFVGSTVYSAAFGTEPYVSTGDEWICEGICDAVTRALYVPVGAQNDVIQDGLLEVLNLLTGQQIRDLWQDRLDKPTAVPR